MIKKWCGDSGYWIFHTVRMQANRLSTSHCLSIAACRMPFIILHSCSLQRLHVCIINNIIILDPCTNLFGICHGKDRLAFSDLQPLMTVRWWSFRRPCRTGSSLHGIWNCWTRNWGAGHEDVTTGTCTHEWHNRFMKKSFCGTKVCGETCCIKFSWLKFLQHRREKMIYPHLPLKWYCVY